MIQHPSNGELINLKDEAVNAIRDESFAGVRILRFQTVNTSISLQEVSNQQINESTLQIVSEARRPTDVQCITQGRELYNYAQDIVKI